MIESIWALDHRRLEEIHDYIQWLFPLRSPSTYNPDAPTLDDETIRAFRRSEPLRERVLRSLDLMLDFYGLSRADSGSGKIVVSTSDAFEHRAPTWLGAGNHNHLRLTRILSSLRLLGLEPVAAALYSCLESIYRSGRTGISRETAGYWARAASGEH
jgi:hypothetical protein